MTQLSLWQGTEVAPVLRDSVQNRVQHYQHSDRHQLLAEIQNVIADQPAAGVHIGSRSVIGAGSVILKDVEEASVVYDCKSKVVRKNDLW